MRGECAPRRGRRRALNWSLQPSAFCPETRTGLETNQLKKLYVKSVAISTHSKRPLFEALWQRHQTGYEFKHDFVRIVLNPSDGQLLAYRKYWGRPPDSFAVEVTKDDAYRTACSRVMAHFNVEKIPKANVSGLVVVCPNTTFGVSANRADTRRLAWVVEVPKQAEYKNAFEVWVDAENGRILGGEIL